MIQASPVLAIDDPHWTSLEGGYRVVYDVSVPLRALTSGADLSSVWDELWNELHHQGDVGEASYAAVPTLVSICLDRQIIDCNLFALIAHIEVCRTQPQNPPLPDWIASAYRDAWVALFDFGLEVLRKSSDHLIVRSVLAVIALHKNQTQLGRILSDYDASEIEEIYAKSFGES